ncbi:MAG: excisionase family DNA-binding protein [Rhodospirillaceae bacterium]|nr:excisionase family DNA-binding protein [Rhodospirillaceae bacterium]
MPTPEKSDLPVYTPQEFASLTGSHYTTVLDALEAGTLPGFRVGRRWVMPKSKCNELLGLPVQTVHP